MSNDLRLEKKNKLRKIILILVSAILLSSVLSTAIDVGKWCYSDSNTGPRYLITGQSSSDGLTCAAEYIDVHHLNF
jgi:hypothetical protein